MNFDFHPAWMRQRLAEAGFHVKHQRTVSHFRLPLLKRLVPAGALAALDGLCQPTGAWWQLTPSVFLDCRLDEAAGRADTPPGAAVAQQLFRCPACGSADLRESAAALACGGCGRRWAVEDGIYDFKEPLP
jgi:hypothetical protein